MAVTRDPAKKRALTDDDYEFMRLPATFWGLKAGHFAKLDSFDFLSAYLSKLHDNIERGVGCLIYGDPYSGKSTKAAYVATVAAEYGYWVRWVTATQLHEEIADKIFDQEDMVPMRQKYMEVDLLVIDDLTNEWECYKRPGPLLQFITDRIHAGMTTIITCPVKDLDALEARNIYPPQMMSKLRNGFVQLMSMDKFAGKAD